MKKKHCITILHVEMLDVGLGLQTPHLSASNIAGTITVAIAPMPTYTTTLVSTL